MNTLGVFALVATIGIGVIIGSLVGMCWVERRVIGNEGPTLSPAEVDETDEPANVHPEPAPEHPARTVVATAETRGRHGRGRFAAEYRRHQAAIRMRVGTRPRRGIRVRRGGTRKVSTVTTSTAVAVAALGCAAATGWYPGTHAHPDLDHGRHSAGPDLAPVRTPSPASTPED